MKCLLQFLLVFTCSAGFATAQEINPWLDSTQINTSASPVCVVNGIIVNLSEINIDFITSMDVARDEKTNKWLGQLAKNGCIYIKADQQFDAITPGIYRIKKEIPVDTKAVVYMLNGCLVNDGLKISKASIKKVYVLSGSAHKGDSNNTYCLSLWTLTDEEHGLPKPKNMVRIRGSEDKKAE